MFVYLLLILALSVDTFILAITYEASKIKIPFSSNFIISFICSLSLIISLLFGKMFENIIPIYILKWTSFFILFGIGIFKIFDSQIKKIIKNIKSKKLNFSFGNIKFIIEIYSDYELADYDKSKTLSMVEAIYLALALSIDSIVSGLAFQVGYLMFIPIFLFSLFINMMMIFSSKIIRNSKIDFSFIGGFIFIILAILKI